MKHRRLMIVVLVIIVALVMLFGCGACCMISAHRCAVKVEGSEAEPTPQPFSANGITHNVYDFGSTGPDVILLHELPGLSIDTVTLARKLTGEGYSVHVPLIFGTFSDKDATKEGFKKCFNEFNCLGNGDSRFAGWLRELIRQRYAGRHVVVIGMCFTGSVALEVADAPGVVAVVMAQPAVPLPLTRWQRAKISVTDEHAAKIKSTGTPILAMRFSEDCMAARERFTTLRSTFPASQIEFEEIDSSKCHEAHATLTGDFSEQAYAHLKAFLKKHAKT
ncbi:MAG TPA: dienelactone hydrolase family protein [Thermoanaerobaculia bacterium]|jgi:dienelactone hydrolase|nr:dienelactone hydrolase family protein [Thermoanaerobaculia bacterium]